MYLTLGRVIEFEIRIVEWIRRMFLNNHNTFKYHGTMHCLANCLYGTQNVINVKSIPFSFIMYGLRGNIWENHHQLYQWIVIYKIVAAFSMRLNGSQFHSDWFFIFTWTNIACATKAVLIVTNLLAIQFDVCYWRRLLMKW